MESDRALPATARTEHVPAWVMRVSRVSWAFVGAVIAAAFVVVVLATLRQIVIPLVLSGFLAVVFAPAVGWLADRRIPRAVGAVLVLLLIIVLASFSVAVLVAGIIDQSDELAVRFDEVVAEIDTLLERSDLTQVVDRLLDGAEGSGPFVGEGFASTVGSVVGTASGFFSGIVLGAILLYYLLKDGPKLMQAAVRSDDPTRSAQAARIVGDAADTIRAYVKGRTVLAIIQAVLIGIVAVFAGVPLALAIALVNLVGGYVPYIGGLIGGTFAVLMALSAGGVPLAIFMLVVVLAVSVGLENLIEPAMLGDKLELHPIVVLFATIIGGLVVGIVGMFLAAPLTAIVRSLWRELRSSGFFEPTTSP